MKMSKGGVLASAGVLMIGGIISLILSSGAPYLVSLGVAAGILVFSANN